MNVMLPAVIDFVGRDVNPGHIAFSLPAKDRAKAVLTAIVRIPLRIMHRNRAGGPGEHAIAFVTIRPLGFRLRSYSPPQSGIRWRHTRNPYPFWREKYLLVSTRLGYCRNGRGLIGCGICGDRTDRKQKKKKHIRMILGSSSNQVNRAVSNTRMNPASQTCLLKCTKKVLELN